MRVLLPAVWYFRHSTASSECSSWLKKFSVISIPATVVPEISTIRKDFSFTMVLLIPASANA